MNGLPRLVLPGLLACLFLGAGARVQATQPATDYAHAPQMRRLLHWPRFPLRVCFVPGELANGKREAATRAGFDEWVRATHGFVRYVIVSNPALADVTVTFLPEAAIPDLENVTGDTGLIFSEQVLQKAHIRLAAAGAPPADLQAVAAHEFGHALGIDGHSDDEADLMYPILARVTPLLTTDMPELPPDPRAITKRDLNTLKTCYPGLDLSSLPKTS